MNPIYGGPVVDQLQQDIDDLTKEHNAKLAELDKLFTIDKRTSIDEKKFEAQIVEIDKLASALNSRKAALKVRKQYGSVEEIALQQLERDKEDNPANASSEFKTIGQQCIAMFNQKWGGATTVDPRLKVFINSGEKGEVKALTDASGASGGFTVPVEFRNTLLSVTGEMGIVRSNGARVVPMTRRQLSIPAMDHSVDPGDTGNSAYYAGIKTYWLEADQPKTETEPTFREITLVAKELGASLTASNTLLDDSAVALEEMFTSDKGLAGAIAHMEDYTFLRGDGAGKPLGILNSPATVSINRATANEVNYEDVSDMMSRILPNGKYVWIANIATRNQLYRMQDGAGQNIWLPHTAGVSAGRAATNLMGYPLNFTEKLPTLGTKGDFMLADLSYYLIGDRKMVTIDSDRYGTLFDKNQTKWRVLCRVDGKPWLNAPIPIADGSGNTLSPFVVLDVPA